MADVLRREIESADAQRRARSRLLDAAEILFADHGFSGASVRDITSAASVNVAAVNYYFGSKEGLYREVLLRRFRPLRERRLAVIAEVLALPRDATTIEDLIRAFATAFLEPVSDWKQGHTLVRLLMREMSDPHLPTELCCTEIMDPVDAALAEGIRSFVPELGESQAKHCVRSMTAQLLHVVQAAIFLGSLETKQVRGASFSEMVEHIVRFTAEGVRGCARRETA